MRTQRADDPLVPAFDLAAESSRGAPAAAAEVAPLVPTAAPAAAAPAGGLLAGTSVDALGTAPGVVPPAPALSSEGFMAWQERNRAKVDVTLASFA